MDVQLPLALLGGLSPAQFMRRHWQKKPLLVRQAIPGFQPFLSRSGLFELASREHVESRLIIRQSDAWTLTSGPLARKSLPPVSRERWTLLVQGVDLHLPAAHALLRQFRFVPDARLDDLMISFATPGGGVGPHFDSYDVFLFQASGRRRWKIGLQTDLTPQPDVPLKMLRNFQAQQEFMLEAGDMLYLPPRYAHDGVAEAGIGLAGKMADCMTYSIGFRAPGQTELAGELLHRLAEFHEDAAHASPIGPGNDYRRRRPAIYRDPGQGATAVPAALPEALEVFAAGAVLAALKDPLALGCVLGEYLTEPKPGVWFDKASQPWNERAAKAGRTGIELDERSRMMYDANHLFINGESLRAKGADAMLMRRLADQRSLSGRDLRRAGSAALTLLGDWHEAGWLRQLAAERGSSSQ